MWPGRWVGLVSGSASWKWHGPDPVSFPEDEDFSILLTALESRCVLCVLMGGMGVLRVLKVKALRTQGFSQ